MRCSWLSKPTFDIERPSVAARMAASMRDIRCLPVGFGWFAADWHVSGGYAVKPALDVANEFG
jgi:hypothetical protein